jgi:hypothetical protein
VVDRDDRARGAPHDLCDDVSPEEARQATMLVRANDDEVVLTVRHLHDGVCHVAVAAQGKAAARLSAAMPVQGREHVPHLVSGIRARELREQIPVRSRFFRGAPHVQHVNLCAQEVAEGLRDLERSL